MLNEYVKPEACTRDTDDNKKNSSLYAAILDKLEVSISGVTLCYYDAASNHTYGASIDALSFSNASQPATFSEHTTKSINMQGFSVFLDHARAPANPEEAARQTHGYLLHPASVELAVVLVHS